MAGAAVGRTLGQLAARWAAIDRQRSEIAAELTRLAKSMAAATPGTDTTLLTGLRRRKGGRPKGFKTSAATRRKLRAAWKRRKAAAKAS